MAELCRKTINKRNVSSQKLYLIELLTFAGKGTSRMFDKAKKSDLAYYLITLNAKVKSQHLQYKIKKIYSYTW